MRRGEVRWYRLARIKALVTNLPAEKNGEGDNGCSLCARLGLTRCRSHLYFGPPPKPSRQPLGVQYA